MAQDLESDSSESERYLKLGVAYHVFWRCVVHISLFFSALRVPTGRMDGTKGVYHEVSLLLGNARTLGLNIFCLHCSGISSARDWQPPTAPTGTFWSCPYCGYGIHLTNLVESLPSLQEIAEHFGSGQEFASDHARECIRIIHLDLEEHPCRYLAELGRLADLDAQTRFATRPLGGTRVGT